MTAALDQLYNRSARHRIVMRDNVSYHHFGGGEGMGSLERGLGLLTTLEQAPHAMTLSELSRAAGLHKATAQRLLIVLESCGFVDKVRGHYQIGSAVVPLARAYQGENSLSRAGQAVLQDLAVSLGETASLFVRQGYDRVVIQRIDSIHPLRYSLQIGQRLPLYAGASGRVLAAAMSDVDLERYLDQVGEVRFRSGRILSRREYMQLIMDARRDGFAISVEERSEGVISVAVPVVVPGKGTIAAINVGGPISRMPEDKARSMIEDVRKGAEELIRAYGRM